jgi:hypothetical protein
LADQLADQALRAEQQDEQLRVQATALSAVDAVAHRIAIAEMDADAEYDALWPVRPSAGE